VRAVHRKVRNGSISNGSNRRWKHQEQRIATALGTSLIANNGARRSDVEAGQYGIEVKTMKAIPARVRSAMEQSVEACGKTGKVPVVVLNQPRIGKKPLRLVVMRFEDWQVTRGLRRHQGDDLLPSDRVDRHIQDEPTGRRRRRE
jgi:hypothetical protein